MDDASYRRITFDRTRAARSIVAAGGYPTRVLEGRAINASGAPPHR